MNQRFYDSTSYLYNIEEIFYLFHLFSMIMLILTPCLVYLYLSIYNIFLYILNAYYEILMQQKISTKTVSFCQKKHTPFYPNQNTITTNCQSVYFSLMPTLEHLIYLLFWYILCMLAQPLTPQSVTPKSQSKKRSSNLLYPNRYTPVAMV